MSVEQVINLLWAIVVLVNTIHILFIWSKIRDLDNEVSVIRHYIAMEILKKSGGKLDESDNND